MNNMEPICVFALGISTGAMIMYLVLVYQILKERRKK